MIIKNNQKYSYQDCWNYAVARKFNYKLETSFFQQTLVKICTLDSEFFWSSFFSKILSSEEYFSIIGKIDLFFLSNVSLPYLTGGINFYKLFFFLSFGVYVPQSDSELIVEKVLEYSSSLWKDCESELKILELGSGSGNLTISLAFEKRNWKIFSFDINPKAVHIARFNSKFYDLRNTFFSTLNFFTFLRRKRKRSETFDVFFSNPPYISKEIYSTLPESTLRQPFEALVASRNGYCFYLNLFENLKRVMNKKFLIVLEIASYQEKKIIQLAVRKFPGSEIFISRDLNDKSRVISIMSS